VSPRLTKPNRLRMRMYQVGFGDSFLLSFEYPRPLPDGRIERHLLVDFGSSRSPGKSDPLPAAAELIAQHTGGKLDVLVCTHRHKDHLSGFGKAETADVIEGLKPTLVVRPWTDDPAAADDATGPALAGESSHRFALGLAQAQTFANALSEAVLADGRRRSELHELALMQLANQAAHDRLEKWAKAGQAAYVFYGSDSQIDEFVPGITVRVLGPPTVEQWPEVTGQKENDPNEYWLSQNRLLSGALAAGGLERTAERVLANGSPIDPGPIRWLVEKMRDQHAASLLRIVRTVDDALNNTSVVLLIDAGDKRLLLSGDAQIENWNYSLKNAPEHEETQKLLKEVDLYKVGHHGSRNATPKTLFNLWGADPDPQRPIVALMSTLSGVHGKTDITRVPSATLVTALGGRTTLHTTDGLTKERRFLEVAAPPAGGKPFKLVEEEP
jgi:hypothetical protein